MTLATSFAPSVTIGRLERFVSVSKKDLALILLSPAILAAILLWQNQEHVLGFIFGPINDPGYFCGTPDPSPVADLGTTMVLQECSAGKTVTIKRGETIAVDLQQSHGVDIGSDWHDLGVSDLSVLGTVVAPTSRDSRLRSDEIAAYRALEAGQSTISAVLVQYSGSSDRYDRGHRWSVTVQVA
jgi:hypothetical protein